MRLILQSIREGKADQRFEVLRYDAETKKGVIRRDGGVGPEFETQMDKPTLEKYGYKVIREE
jgi:hypothetical protein